MKNIDKMLYNLSKSKFRSSFHLNNKMKDYVSEKGLSEIQKHAYDFINKRLKPKQIPNDGKQTPMKQVHPIFIAQHACACCCRKCLYKWHGISLNKELTDEEVNYIVLVLMHWIRKEMNMERSKVYFTKEISSDSLINIYEALGVDLKGNVGVKVSTGESGSKGYLKANIIGPLVQKLNGTIIECNTAYPGKRNTQEEHLKVAKEHGFTSFAPVDIMDANGEFKIPVKNGKHLKYDIIGENFKKYDSIINLAHGKGHAMGGFGANLKNQSIGIASRNGKAYIHSCGKTDDPNKCWSVKYEQRDFIESMAEAAASVSDYLNENNKQIIYITVMNALSVDCDCDANQGDPVMSDLGIVASLDPVANDQAFIDMIWSSTENGSEKLRERVDRQEGRHITEYAQSIGLGTTNYELIEI